MKDFNIAVLGCGTVGGGVAQILLQMGDDLSKKAGYKVRLKKIVELSPKTASVKFNIPLDLFCGNGKDLSKEEASAYINEVIGSEDIDLVVETIGGSNDFIEALSVNSLKSGKHLVTANKALLAKRGPAVYEAGEKANKLIGYEAAVCGAIPIIKTIKESLTGDEITSLSGIMNGTSNYILTKMHDEGMDFLTALKLAQEKGYAEADPTLDINGHDAGHKLIILMRLAFGLELPVERLSITGVNGITPEDIRFAREIDCRIKLICYAKKSGNDVYALVCPMMVKNSNFLSGINGATNAVNLTNRFSGKHTLVGAGAGSLETASSIVADIVFIARYAEKSRPDQKSDKLAYVDARQLDFPYIITFDTEDMPGITGLVTTAIGQQNINIDTVSHNMHKTDAAVFSVATMPCTMQQIEGAIKSIKEKSPNVLLGDPKVIPILY